MSASPSTVVLVADSSPLMLARMKAEGYFLSEALVREVLRRSGE